MANGLRITSPAQPDVLGTISKGLALRDQIEQRPLMRQQRQQQQLGSQDQARISSIVNGAVQLNNIQSPQGKIEFLNQRRQQLQQAGIGTEDTDEALALANQGRWDELNAMTQRAIGIGQNIQRTSKQQELDQFLSMPENTEQERIAKKQVGQAIGAISKHLSAQERADIQQLVGDIKAGQAVDVAEGKADVELKTKPNIEKQKLLAKDSAKLSTEIFSRMEGVEENIRNMKEGIRLVDEGAATGPVNKWLPSLKETTVKLDNLKNRLGLDVIGSVTFGALSAGELKVAFDTAVPANLRGEALKSWFQERIDAQEKLFASLEDAGIFLSEDGATIPKLMARRRQQRISGQQETQDSLSDADLMAKYGIK